LIFFLKVGELKEVLRTGWINKNVKDPENLTEHHFQVAFLAMVLADKLGDVDKNKLIKMALIHDMSELITGDEVIINRWSKKGIKQVEEKHKREREAMTKIFKGISNSEEYISLFDEFMDRKTLEARILKELDMLQMCLQAFEYENKQNINLGDFYKYSDPYIKNVEIRKMFNELLKNREIVVK